MSNWLVLKLAKRYTFLIDPAGKIVKTYLSVDISRHSAGIAADLKQFKSLFLAELWIEKAQGIAAG